MKAIVTGGTGFIGSKVVHELLKENHSVRILSRSKSITASFRDNVDVSVGDLERPQSLIEALDGMDLLFHVGEIKNVSRAAADLNVRLIDTILGHIRETTIRRIVYVSSITVSGVPSVLPATEDTEPKLIFSDQYTDSKRRSENLLISAAGDVEFSIIRPAPVYGPGSRNLGKFIDLIGKLGPIGIPFPGDAQNLAPLIHVDDLARAICAAGTEPAAAGRIFNLTDGLRHSWIDFLRALADGLGTKIRIVPLPAVLLKMTALPLDLLAGLLGFSLDPVTYITYLSEDLLFDNSRTKELLGWKPGYIFPEGIPEMIEFYRQQ